MTALVTIKSPSETRTGIWGLLSYVSSVGAATEEVPYSDPEMMCRPLGDRAIDSTFLVWYAWDAETRVVVGKRGHTKHIRSAVYCLLTRWAAHYLWIQRQDHLNLGFQYWYCRWQA